MSWFSFGGNGSSVGFVVREEARGEGWHQVFLPGHLQD